MKSKVPIRPIIYIVITVAFFIVFILAEHFFGFDYESVEHELPPSVGNVPKEQPKAKDSTQEQMTFQEDPLFTEKQDTTETISEESSTLNNETQINDSNSSSYFDDLMSDYRQNVVSKLGKNKARTDIVIRYYHHEPDGNSAYVLGNLGYYIHEREVAPEYLNYQSNAIFYGDSVSLQDIQIVSYTLITNGLPIKIIKPSKFHDSWKAHSIEIGTDTTAVHQPTIQLNAIQHMTL